MRFSKKALAIGLSDLQAGIERLQRRVCLITWGCCSERFETVFRHLDLSVRCGRAGVGLVANGDGAGGGRVWGLRLRDSGLLRRIQQIW